MSLISGFRFGLPPNWPLYWLAGFFSMARTWAVVRWKTLAQVATSGLPAVRPAQGSMVPSSADVLRREQLDDVRRADGAVVAGAEAQAVDDLPVAGHLVGVGVADRGVVGEAVAELQRDVLGERHVADQRDAGFAEQLVDVEAAVDRRRWPPPLPLTRPLVDRKSAVESRCSRRYSAPNATPTPSDGPAGS